MKKKERLYKCPNCKKPIQREVPSLEKTYATYKSYCDEKGQDVILIKITPYWPIVKTLWLSSDGRAIPNKVSSAYKKMRHVGRIFNGRYKFHFKLEKI